MYQDHCKLLAINHSTTSLSFTHTKEPKYTTDTVPTPISRHPTHPKLTTTITYHAHSINLPINQQALLHIKRLIRPSRNIRNRQLAIRFIINSTIRNRRAVAFQRGAVVVGEVFQAHVVDVVVADGVEVDVQRSRCGCSACAGTARARARATGGIVIGAG